MVDHRTLSPDQLEQHYNPRLAVPDFEDYFARQEKMSADAAAVLTGHTDLHYGSATLQTLDLYPAAEPKAPVHIFVHGGYWRALDKALYRYIAPALVAEGISVILVNYRLAPAVTVGEIIDDTVAAVRWTHDRISQYGGDPDRITLSGHSAGAHLAALAMAHDWQAEGKPADIIKGAALFSGIYDTELVPLLEVNQEIGLTPEHASTTSAFLLPPALPDGVDPPKLIIGAGTEEPAGWIAQSTDFAGLCTRLGFPVTHENLEGENHMGMMEQMADPKSQMFGLVRGLVG